MTTIDEIVNGYFEVWNEQDPQRRAELIERTWSDDGSYIDPLHEGNGPEGIHAMVADIHQQFPGHRLELAGQIDQHHGRIRFAWQMVEPAAGEAVIEGTDFCVIAEDGRLRSVTSFIDRAPALGISG